nr:uncharacterized protein LOC117860835 [Setaria viridis]XP_034600115.1 uncharacterized protein LOC117860835 [Setaria viridis]
MGLPAACRSWLAAASGRGTSKTLAAAAAGALTSSPPLAASPTKALFLPTRRHSTTTIATEHPQVAPIADGPAPPPPPTSPWVILGSIPRVVRGGGGGGGADVSLALAAPPRVSRLSVSSRVFPDRPTPQNFPFVLAADGSGLLLLSAILAAPLTRVESADRKSL